MQLFAALMEGPVGWIYASVLVLLVVHTLFRIKRLFWPKNS